MLTFDCCFRSLRAFTIPFLLCDVAVMAMFQAINQPPVFSAGGGGDESPERRSRAPGRAHEADNRTLREKILDMIKFYNAPQKAKSRKYWSMSHPCHSFVANVRQIEAA